MNERQKQREEHFEFLKNLGKQTVTWHDTVMTPNICGNPVRGKICYTNDKFSLTKEEFEKVFHIVREELLIVLPIENLMGFVGYYDIRDLDVSLLLRLGRENLPQDASPYFEDMYDQFVRHPENLDLYKQLIKEKKHLPQILGTFEEHCY